MKFSSNPFSFFPHLITYESDNFLELLENNKRWLDNNLSDLGEKLNLYSQEEIEERFYDEIVVARDELPSLTYLGLFLAIFAFSEKTMKDICIWYKIGLGDNSLSVTTKSNRIIKTIKNSSFTIEHPQFISFLNILIIIRNSLVHRYGNLSKSQYQEILSITNKYDNFLRFLEFKETPFKIIINYEFLKGYIAWNKTTLINLSHNMDRGNKTTN